MTLVGKAGTGKTLLALAAGLKRTLEDGAFTRMLVSRPVMPLGRDIGFLPGDVDEKLNPWMQPIFDNLEFLFSTGSRKGPRAYAELLESGQIQVEPLTYIRGRIASRSSTSSSTRRRTSRRTRSRRSSRARATATKIVLTGDPGQIDNPYVDSASNGLTIAAEHFRGEKLAGAHRSRQGRAQRAGRARREHALEGALSFGRHPRGEPRLAGAVAIAKRRFVADALRKCTKAGSRGLAVAHCNERALRCQCLIDPPLSLWSRPPLLASE